MRNIKFCDTCHLVDSLSTLSFLTSGVWVSWMRNIHFATHLIYYSVHPISFVNVWGGRFMDEKNPIVTHFHLLDSAWSRYHFRSGCHGRLCHFLGYIIWHNLPVMIIHFVVIIVTKISVEHLYIHFFNLWKNKLWRKILNSLQFIYLTWKFFN